MISAQELGGRISRMFNFIYEINGDYYVLGQDYFRLCSDLEIGVYKGFKEAFDGKKDEIIIAQYKRVRRYTSDCRPNSRTRDKEIVAFVQSLNEGDLKALSIQVDKALSYAQIAYR